MNFFTRDDGVQIQMVPGFRERALSYRAAVSPRAGWADADYAGAAAKKRKRFQRLADQARAFGFDPRGRTTLDVGCGDGSNCLLLAEAGAKAALGIDLEPALLAPAEKGERTRRLAAHLIGSGTEGDLAAHLARLPMRLETMDAARMSFADGAFDFVMSRSAMEHVRPVDRTLREIARVTRPGGLIYLSIDPFFWLRGCHKRGVVDIPWAHARLTLDEYRRFVSDTEGATPAARRHERLESLNRLTLAQWRAQIDATGCTVLEWREDVSTLGETVLREHPDVTATLLPGVTARDLLRERIKVWLRRGE